MSLLTEEMLPFIPFVIAAAVLAVAAAVYAVVGYFKGRK